MAASAMVGGAGEPHWLDEEVTIDFLQKKVGLKEQVAADVHKKLNAKMILNVQDLLGFSEQELMKQIELEPGLAKRMRNYNESCEVDETFLTRILRLRASALLQVNAWLTANQFTDVGLLLLQSREDLVENLEKGPGDVLWGFIEKQKGKLYCSKYYWEYSHTNIFDESQLKSQLILVFLKHLMSQLIVSFL